MIWNTFNVNQTLYEYWILQINWDTRESCKCQVPVQVTSSPLSWKAGPWSKTQLIASTWFLLSSMLIHVTKYSSSHELLTVTNDVVKLSLLPKRYYYHATSPAFPWFRCFPHQSYRSIYCSCVLHFSNV